MHKNPINTIILEGPDLSGKSTLFKMLHDKSGYRWNIQDRSSLSMVVYSKLYNRPEFDHVERLNFELNNLNNQMIILLPKWEVIVNRFYDRGDEIQNFISLRKVYDLFKEAANELETLPNVSVLTNEVDDFIIDSLISGFTNIESASFSSIADRCLTASAAGKNLEKVGLRFISYDNGAFADVNLKDLQYEKEKVYYDKIKEKVLRKIEDELVGINEYSRIEDINSRRFIYTSDTCISLAHFLYRGGILDAKYFLRSSNTRDTLQYDLNFLKYLSSRVKEKLNLPDSTVIKLDVTVNSAHVPSSIEGN